MTESKTTSCADLRDETKQWTEIKFSGPQTKVDYSNNLVPSKKTKSMIGSSKTATF